jgi:hypothetical protein
MKTKIFIISILLFSSTYLLGQTKQPENLNRFDSNGVKYGWHIDYLDKSWTVVTKDKSYYYVYTFYYNGKNYDSFKFYIKNGTLKQASSIPMPKLGEPEALNGQFTWLNKYGKIQSEMQFKDGFRIGTFKIYKAGKISVEANFDQKYDNHQDFSYYITFYKKNGRIAKKGYYRNGQYEDKFELKNGYFIYEE